MNTQLFYDRLINIRKLYVDEMNILLSQFQLTTSSYQVFKTIKKQSPTNLVSVAKALNIEKPSATKLIQKLRDMELIDISPGADRREKILTLSTKGTELFNEISERIALHQQDALSDVTAYDTLLNELEHIEHYYQNRKDNGIEKQ